MSMPIRIKKDTIEEIKRLKVHPRETYDDVIKRLIEAWKGRTPSR
jgi:predicted CopG family antitoxin